MFGIGRRAPLDPTQHRCRCAKCLTEFYGRSEEDDECWPCASGSRKFSIGWCSKCGFQFKSVYPESDECKQCYETRRSVEMATARFKGEDVTPDGDLY